MGLSGILFILVLLIFLTVFIVMIVKSARAWGALNIVLLSILFIQCWVFMVFTAGVHHERVRATKDAHTQRERARLALAESKRLRYGTVDAPIDSLEAVVPVQGRLERLTIDRGRVWRRLTFVGQQAISIRLNVQTAQVPQDPLAEEPAPAVSVAAGSSLPENLVVYAFEEQPDDEGHPLPVFYLGEYRVTRNDAASGEITIESTLPFHPLHQARIAQGVDSWTLYELLPIDSHSAFAALGAEPNDEYIFGRPDEERIRELLAGVPESVLDGYLRDGQRASENDRPETIWEQISLLRELQVDVDSDQSADATISGYFDQTGRSIDLRLKRGAQVSLTPGDLREDRIVVLESEARDLISRGLAERVQRIFVRPLNDYLGMFNRKYATAFELEERIKYYQHQNQLIDDANQTGQSMLAFRQQENQLLTSDLGNFQKEIQVLNPELASAVSALESLKQQLSRLYRAIQERHQQLIATGI